MSAFQFLFAWYNIPFLVALGCCLFFALVQLIGGFGDNDADTDVDADVDVDLDIDANADGGFDADLDSAAAHHGGGAGLLGWLGVGQVPLVLVLIALLGSFGFIGLLTSALLIETLALPITIGAVAMITGLLLGFFATGALSRAFGRIAGRSNAAISNEQLVGRAGIVVSPSVSPSYGRVAVRDSHGTLHTIFAVVEGSTNLPERAEVAVTRYDAVQRRFVVRALR
ncbi:YqiJ family protein [Candidatus Gracilibacteria bacterium]|nr:YqiJ family protein [Candidatus Gracilibacteria bacterium]